MGGGGVNSGMLYVTLVPPKERKLDQAAISTLIRRELNAIPGIRAVIQDTSQQGFTAQRGFPVEFSVRGSDWNQLVPLSQKVMSDLSASGAVVDLDSDYRVGMPELRVTPDRAVCADVGVSVDEVATTINALVGGIRVGKYSTGGRRLDVRLKLMAGQRSSPNDISRLRVRARNGELVPLSTLVVFEEKAALQAITRRERERAISIYANVAPGHAQAEALRVVEGLGKTLPVGYRLVLGGSSMAFRESMSSLLFAMFLGIAIAYMILASQFNSFKDPVTIITILPLSIAGAAFALLITRQSLNIFSMIGLLLLMGIVKKNSIILVDYANAFREKGFGAKEAMEKAGPDPAEAHPDDGHGDHDGGHPAGPRHRLGLGDPYAHGHRRHRRVGAVDRPEPDRRPGILRDRRQAQEEEETGRSLKAGLGRGQRVKRSGLFVGRAGLGERYPFRAERTRVRLESLDLEGQETADGLSFDRDGPGAPVDQDVDPRDGHVVLAQAGHDLLDRSSRRQDVLDDDGPRAVEPGKARADGHLLVGALGEGELLAQLEGGQEADGDGAVGGGDDVIEIGDLAPRSWRRGGRRSSRAPPASR